jgi:hypothetical protein
MKHELERVRRLALWHGVPWDLPTPGALEVLSFRLVRARSGAPDSDAGISAGWPVS